MNISCCKSYVGKQIIGLLPNQSECLFYYAPDTNIDFWSVAGYSWDEVSAINVELNPYGIYYNIYTTNNIAEPRFVLTYVGTEPPTYLPSIIDDKANPVTWGWTSCCNKVCLEATLKAGDYVLFQTGYFIEAIQNPTPFNHPSLPEYLKSLYGQQTLYTFNDNGDGTFYIKIDNAYVCNPPLAWSADNVTYTDMVPCGTPSPECLYIGYIDLNAGGSLSDYTLDDNTTLLLNDVFGNGYLRNLMQLQGGEVYALFLDNSNFIIQGVQCIYRGTTANNIDVNFMGNYFGTISFTRLSDLNIDCEPNYCYSLTLSTDYSDLTYIQFGFSPYTLSAELSQSAPNFTDIQISDITSFDNLIKNIYGSQAIYTIIDNNDGTITIYFNNVYDFGNPLLTFVGKGVGPDTFTMNNC